jgi:carbon-monoxide dehydrogenase medium subunit
MKPAAFAYHAPSDLGRVLELLGDSHRDARVIAGGQSLVPMMNFRIATPSTLVDLRRVTELQRLEVDDSGGLIVGAGVTQSRLLEDERVAARWPLLAQALRHVGHPQVRNRGTVCGSLAHHDPAAELPAAALALDARIVVEGLDGRREVDAADFFVSYYETALRPGELIVEVRVPARDPGEGHAFLEVARKHGDFALVGAAALVRRTPDDRLGGVRLVLFGIGDRARRFIETEQQLVDLDCDVAEVRSVVDAIRDVIDPIDDNRAGAEYRRDVACALAVDAVVAAWGAAGE